MYKKGNGYIFFSKFPKLGVYSFVLLYLLSVSGISEMRFDSKNPSETTTLSLASQTNLDKIVPGYSSQNVMIQKEATQNQAEVLQTDTRNSLSKKSNDLYSEIKGSQTDTTPPTIIFQSPQVIATDQELGVEFTLRWGIVDSAATGIYNIKRNETIVKQSPSIPLGGAEADIEFLDAPPLIGNFTYNITVTDDSGNSNSTTITVKVVDRIGPSLISSGNTTVELGETKTISWMITDKGTGTYILSNETGQIDTGVWNQESLIISYLVNRRALGAQEYNLTVIDDANTLTSTNITKATVVDTTAPVLTSPDDTVLELGSSGLITWTITDFGSGTYTIHNATDIVKMGSWNQTALNIMYQAQGSKVDFIDYNLTVIDSQFSQSDLVRVTVTDTFAPVLSSPTDKTVELGSIVEITWIITDLGSGIYLVFRNGAQVTDGTWNQSSLTIMFQAQENAIDLSTYNLTVMDSQKHAFDVVEVTKVDNTPPVLDSPNDLFIEFGSDRVVTWNITDFGSGTYSINDTTQIIDSGNWDQNNLAINLRFGPSGFINEIGSVEYTLMVTDATNTVVTDAVRVTINDTTTPVLVSPDDVTIELGSSATVAWTVIDLGFGNYTISNGTDIVATGTWDRNSLQIDYVIQVDTLGLIQYNFTATDATNAKQVFDIVQATIEDKIKPNITEEIDQTIELGSSTIIQWDVTDFGSGTYTILKGTQQVADGVWGQDNLQISLMLTYSGLANEVGVDNYNLMVIDDSMNSKTDIVRIVVRDTTAPTITNSGDETVEVGEMFTISWVITDLTPDTYAISNGSHTLQSDNWLSGSTVSISLLAKFLTPVTFTLIARDESNNFDHSAVQISLMDTVTPILGVPVDQIIELGNDWTISWPLVDKGSGTFIILQNTTQISSGTWSSADDFINFTADFYYLEMSTYTLRVTDTGNNIQSNEVEITIQDTFTPEIISTPATATFEANINSAFSIFVKDNRGSTGSYTIFRNTSIVTSSGLWTVNEQTKAELGLTYADNISVAMIQFEFFNIRPGLYSYNITVSDGGNLQNFHLFVLTLIDTTSPQITVDTINTNLDLREQVTLKWNIRDADFGTYKIFAGAEKVREGNWNSSGSVSFVNYTVFSITPKQIIYTLNATDNSGNSKQNSIFITISDKTRPMLTQQSEIELVIEFGETKLITWTIEDNGVGTYQILRDNLVIRRGNYNRTTTIPYLVDEPTIDIHTFRLVATDNVNVLHTAEHRYHVSIVDTIFPVLNGSSDVFTVVNRQAQISWTIDDISYGNYAIRTGFAQVTDGTWSSTQNFVSFEVPTDVAGTFQYIITVTDASGNSVIGTISVIINDGLLPTLEEISDFTIELGQSISIKWIAEDTDKDHYKITHGETIVQDGSWTSSSLSTSLTTPPLGQYTFGIEVVDSYNNSVRDQVTVFVVDMTVPIFDGKPQNRTLEIGFDIESLQWSVSDYAAESYVITRNEETVATGVWDSATNITHNIKDLPLGEYIYVVTISDASGNSASHIVKVTVMYNSTLIVFLNLIFLAIIGILIALRPIHLGIKRKRSSIVLTEVKLQKSRRKKKKRPDTK